MSQERKISIAIPSYNRAEMTVDSFIDVYGDERVNDICIVDDESDIRIYENLSKLCEGLDKVVLYRNEKNLDCYKNKATAVSNCQTDWCILLDSDNKIGKDYLDIIFDLAWENDTCYMPSFAAPTFNYENYSGLVLSKENVYKYIERPLFDTMLNCMNYFVNKNEYLRIWEDIENPHTADSILQNYNWFNGGNKMYVVPNLKYNHLIHDGSHYKNNVHKTKSGYYESIVQKLKDLK